MTLFSLFI